MSDEKKIDQKPIDQEAKDQAPKRNLVQEVDDLKLAIKALEPLIGMLAPTLMSQMQPAAKAFIEKARAL